MRSRAALALFGLLVALAFAGPAAATVSEALSLRQLIEQADHVVLGTAVGEHARRDARGRIVTDFTLRVDEVLKGDARVGGTLVMTRLGGVLGDLGMRIEGEPHLAIGTRYLVFLRRMGGTLRPVGMSQGVLEVQDDGGDPIVLPGGGGMSLVERARGGQLVPAPAALLHPEPYVQLRERVEQVVEEEQRGTVRP